MTTLKKTLLVALAAFIILRLPSFFEPHWYADEGVYAGVTYGMEQGRQLYVDLWDNKPPLIYYLYSLGNTHNRLFVIKYLNLIAGLATILGFYELLRLLKFNEKFTAGGLFLAVFMLGTTLIEGNIANAENFFLPLIVWAYVLSLRKKPYYGMAGALLGLGFLLKFHPFFNFVALALYLLFTRSHIKNLLTLFAGFVTPIIVQFAILYFQGNLLPALDTIFLNNFGYTQSYSTGIHSLGLRTAVLGIGVLVTLALRWKKKISQRLFFIVLIAFFELYGAFFGGRKYYHYLIQAIPIATVAFALLLEKMHPAKLTQRIIYLTGSFVLVFFIVKAFFSAEGFAYAYPVLPYYSQFIAYATHQQPYFIDTTEETLQKMRIAKWNYSGTIYIFTTNPWIYDVLEITPTVKIVASYHRYFIGINNYMNSVRSVSPDVVIMDTRADQSEEFNEYLQENYLPSEKIDYYQFWLREFSTAEE